MKTDTKNWIDKIKPMRMTIKEEIVIKTSPTMKELRKILRERIERNDNNAK